MPLFSFEGKSPTVHPAAWIAPTATLVGDVVVEEGASIWYGVVIRADLGRITIRAGANIQDNTVIHVGSNGCEVGPNATVGHQCLVHDCVIGDHVHIAPGAKLASGVLVGDGSHIGLGAAIIQGKRVGRNAVVGAGAVVVRDVPDDVVVTGVPARVLRTRSGGDD